MSITSKAESQTACERFAAEARQLALELPPGPVRIMEVCGSHTMAIARHGLKAFLPEGVTLLSGPGCPVCVTDEGYIDALIGLARIEGVTVCTFGDMIKVPGSETSLERARSEGADVRVVYSPLDALQMARDNPSRRVVLAAVGFETTAPLIAATVLQAYEAEVGNFGVLPAHKLVPPALRALLDDPECRIDAFICPGNVSIVIGSAAYEPIVEQYRVPSVVAGFEPADVMEAIPMLLRQMLAEEPKVDVQYRRVVTREGNRRARETMYEVYEPCDAVWRGIGPIPASGLRIREKYAAHDAYRAFGLSDEPLFVKGPCRCGDVLKGIIAPADCALFGAACTPRNPLGPCMVSSEGSCAAAYKYGDGVQR